MTEDFGSKPSFGPSTAMSSKLNHCLIISSSFVQFPGLICIAYTVNYCEKLLTTKLKKEKE